MTNDIAWERDADGIVTLTMDAQGGSANTMTESFSASLAAVTERLAAESGDVIGVVLTSAKRSFFAGGNLNDLITATRDQAPALQERFGFVKAQLRALERLPVPVVAAINGAALGGGLEIALACQRRIAVDAAHVKLGLPEVTLGLLPGGGGVIRSVHLLGLERALDELLLTGRSHPASSALHLGLVDELVSDTGELVTAAKRWIKEAPEATAPWDRPDHLVPGLQDRPIEEIEAAVQANLAKRFKGAPYPAPHAILATAVEGARLDFDEALVNETRHFVELLTGQTAKNMIKHQFFDLQRVTSGAARPAAVPKFAATRIGIVGAGMMGAGIAYMAARNGLSVVLKDVSAETAEQGKDYSRKLVEKQVARGIATENEARTLLDRIVTTDTMADLAGCEAIVEAVFEDPELKKSIFADIAKHAPEALLASNTSTLPISDLAEGTLDPARFIGMHFFSPVDRMPLLEIVVGRATSDETLAHAFDLGLALRKTPIVVNDGRGFFTSRVITTHIDEALALVGEGVPADVVEQAATQSGYPAGPLQLIDETSITLAHKVRMENRTAALAAGREWIEHPAEPVMTRMVEEFQRHGRAAGAGFYDYADGRRTGLWKGLAEHFGDDTKIPFEDVKDRLLFVEALETVRCFDDGVLNSAADANVGSVLGIGFPRWTGGVIQFIEGYPGGPQAFVHRARELAARYGNRFTPPPSLVEHCACR
jgi:3-hydroxyacyl-CoA dehydrogenase/enoyl-CoA hydratase/3-hydroxybutyryl-CoA epimerase